MAMTKIERMAKEQITDILASQGYATYAKLFQYFDLNLTNDPNVIGYMQVDKARIVLNQNLSDKQVSTIVRHEILHEYLTHYARELALQQKDDKYKNVNHDIYNIAGDFEISNRGYTDEDKKVTRNIILNDKQLRGLVTEDEFPDWQNKSFEEMVDLLINEKEKYENKLKDMIQQLSSQGDPSTQQAEEIERQANAVSDDAGEMIAQENQKGSSGDQEKKDAEKKIQQQADKISQQASETKDEADKLEKETTGKVFKDSDEQAKAEKIAARVEKLKKILQNTQNAQAVLDETRNVKDKEAAVKKAKDLAKYRATPIEKFEVSLTNFIKKAVGVGRESTWKRMNNKYAGTGIVRAGRSTQAQSKVPLVNVYFDRSGSFSGYPEKTRRAEEIVGTLNKYVRQGRLQVNLYYATTEVYSDRAEAEKTYGGMDADPVIEHIKQTQPDNVIILTDSDASGAYGTVHVPGAVWILFFESDAEDLAEHVIGDMETETYLIKGNA